MFLPDVVAPAELPVEMRRVQVAAAPVGKGFHSDVPQVLPAVLRADVPLRVKAEAFLHLTANFNYLLAWPCAC